MTLDLNSVYIGISLGVGDLQPLLNVHRRLMQVKKIDIVKQMLMLNWKFGECFDWEDCVMIGQAISEHFNEGVELKSEPERYRGRSGARKIRKIIKRCKADTEAIKRLDDEQKEFLERLRKHL